MTPEQIKEAIASAKNIVAQRLADIEAKKKATALAAEQAVNLTRAVPLSAELSHTPKTAGLTWNVEQQTAIDYAVYKKSFCLIGAAGTGKTTTLKGALQALLEGNHMPPLESGTKHLAQGAPGIALISYTRRAVRNIAKQMPDALKPHCITFHKLVEYAPEYYMEWSDEKGEHVNKMRFAPSKNYMNPLPRNLKLIVVDEASMLSTDYFQQLIDALPNPSQVQFIFLGDLNQLPPVYGQAILGKMLLQLPIVELTRVYRQALESPIISLALAVKDNNFTSFQKDAVDIWGLPAKHMYGDGRADNPVNYAASFEPKKLPVKVTVEKEGRGKVTLHPWKKQLAQEDALIAMQSQLRMWIKDGTYDPDEDLVLCPWNKSFGTDELNLAIADCLGQQRQTEVHEIIAGYNKYYWAVGDKLLIDKMEAKIISIEKNFRYLGKKPQPASKTLNRWGHGGSAANFFDEEITNDQIDAMLEAAASVDDRTAEASHAIKVLFLDTDEEETITKSATINASSFAYAITVHKAQGSECRKVFLITHACHAAMCSRELIYTAITRAAQELYIIMPPDLLAKAASKPRIKGDTLAAKLEFYQSRLSEKE